MKKLIAAKKAGKEPPRPPEPQPSNVINLMDALRRSVQGGRGRAPAEAGRRTKATKPAAHKRAAPKRKKLRRAS